MRDPYTAGHQRRVSELAPRIAEEVGISARQIEEIRIAALIQDVGKVSVPSEPLSKPGTLSPAELERRGARLEELLIAARPSAPSPCIPCRRAAGLEPYRRVSPAAALTKHAGLRGGRLANIEPVLNYTSKQAFHTPASSTSPSSPTTPPTSPPQPAALHRRLQQPRPRDHRVLRLRGRHPRPRDRDREDARRDHGERRGEGAAPPRRFALRRRRRQSQPGGSLSAWP